MAMLGLRSTGLHILLGGASDGFQPKRRLWNATPEVRAVRMLADVGPVLCVRKGRKLLGKALAVLRVPRGSLPTARGRNGFVTKAGKSPGCVLCSDLTNGEAKS